LLAGKENESQLETLSRGVKRLLSRLAGHPLARHNTDFLSRPFWVFFSFFWYFYFTWGQND